MTLNNKLLILAGLGLCVILVLCFVVLSEKPGRSASAVAPEYFEGMTVDGHTFKVLNGSQEIPYQAGDMKDPANYSAFIGVPTNTKWPVWSTSSDRYEYNDTVQLYTWSEQDGLLIRWNVELAAGKVTILHANLMDVEVGAYRQDNASRFIPALGVDVTGPDAEDVFWQFSSIYRNRSSQFDGRLSMIDGRFDTWAYGEFRTPGIYERAGPGWFALEPGYIYDYVSGEGGETDWQKNVTAWGYYNNNSTFFSGLPGGSQFPGYNGSSPLKAFYISYYTVG